MTTALQLQLPLLVSGASGQLGCLVLSDLLDIHRIPPEDIIATTRTPGALSKFAKRGVTVREANFDRPDSLVQAFSGAKRMLIVSTTPELPYIQGDRLRKQSAAIKAGVEAGVEHILYTSAPNPEPGTPCFWKPDHYKTELVLMDSGVTWTVLRNWDYPNGPFIRDWSFSLQTGEYWTSSGAGRINYVTREDCARAAAGALISEFSANRRFDITGPEALTIDEIMATLSEITGRKIAVIHCTPREHEAHLVARGKDHPLFIPIRIGFALAAKQGRYDGITNSVERLSGRKPTRLRDWFAANAGP